ncbi:unnamed protein product [Brassica rapa subsp. trilocularis]
MVVMLEIVVVAAGIVIASAADPRESLIGATMLTQCIHHSVHVDTVYPNVH